MPRSLQLRLATALAAGLAVLSVAAAAASFHVLRHEIDRISDSALQETAQRLLPLAAMEILGRDADGSDSQRIAAVRPHDELLTYVVRDATGKTLLQSHDADETVFPPKLRAGFVSTATHRVYAETGLEGTMSLLVAEPLKARRHAEIKAALAVGRAVALFLPVGLAGIWLIVRTGLRPVRRFCGSIATRGQNDLSPLDKQSLPVEMTPIADAVNDLMARLERALAAERNITANSAHELRTPIAAALAQTQRLIAEAPSAPLRERARNVEGALRALSQVSEKLMQLARAEDGRVLADTPQDLRPVLLLVIDDFRRAANASSIELDLPEDPVLSRIDPDAFAIVVRNLIENALNHGAAGGPIRVVLSPGGTFSVTNHGQAVQYDVLGRLTKQFERGTSMTKGSGLGLAIVDTIAKGAGATLSLHSPAPGWPDGFQAVIDGLLLVSGRHGTASEKRR
ncbi:MAG: HAMP domain-containing histidine kinase [Paraburkholderia sp.]|uniref:sensor histidine kinase n=1 Tax=Paraburkholderia sp. TaxID=1926495 RepID=UPI001207ECD2|nr:HAMP domain-containing sensor histidine kinase [Paraburkholderia sp.]TAM05676.1 MAG: HAMP domain-containing histidine kinase [Paraburkholderia sp.]